MATTPSEERLVVELPTLCDIGYQSGGAHSLRRVPGLVKLTIAGGPTPPESAVEWRERRDKLRAVLKEIATAEVAHRLGEQYEQAALKVFRLDAKQPLAYPQRPTLTEIQDCLTEDFGEPPSTRGFVENHRQELFKVIAESLVEREEAAREGTQQTASTNGPAPGLDGVSLLQAQPHFIDIEIYLRGLALDPLCDLIAQLSGSYSEFARALGDMHRAAERGNDLTAQYGTPVEQPDESDYFHSLHMLARRGFTRAERTTTDGATLKPLRISLATFMADALLGRHLPDPLSPHVWLCRTVAILEENFLPHYTLREQDLLRHAAQEAGDNLHVFLHHLESTEHGRAVLANWIAALTLDAPPQEPPWVSDTLAGWDFDLHLISAISNKLDQPLIDGIEIGGLTEVIAAFESRHMRGLLSDHLDAYGYTYPGIRPDESDGNSGN